MKLSPLFLWAGILATGLFRLASVDQAHASVVQSTLPPPDNNSAPILVGNATNSTAQTGSIKVTHDPPLLDLQKWNTLRQLGCKILEACSAVDAVAGQMFPRRPASVESRFQNYPDDLTSWGYTQYDASYAFYNFPPNYFEAFRALGFRPGRDLGDLEQGPNKAISFEHDTDTVHNGVNIRATKAIIDTIVNPSDGVIIAWVKMGPRSQGAQQSPPVTVLPSLSNWSDYAFLSWIAAGGATGNPGVRKLREIFYMNIQGSEFPGVIGQALLAVGRRHGHADWTPFVKEQECQNYPWGNRVEFDLQQEAGKVVLGSHEARGPAFLILQHKSTFGARSTFSGIAFYCTNDAGFWNMHLVFHVQHRN